MTRVVLLSDFGTVDGYAATMAAVVASAAPSALIEHAAHDIPAGDILTGALTLSRYATLYPHGTVHLAVVDPGVGTWRRPIAATVDGRHYVGPDNGLFTRILVGRQARIVDVRETGQGRGASPTFHGRDIFAPAAGHLAAGGALEDLGPAVADPVVLDLAEPRRHGHLIGGEVIQVDRFGNLISNVPAGWIAGLSEGEGGARVVIDGKDAGPVRRTYGDVASGDVVALIGSLDLLEISVRDGSAAEFLDAGRGALLEVRAG